MRVGIHTLHSRRALKYARKFLSDRFLTGAALISGEKCGLVRRREPKQAWFMESAAVRNLGQRPPCVIALAGPAYYNGDEESG